jgi:hypothetical protein
MILHPVGNLKSFKGQDAMDVDQESSGLVAKIIAPIGHHQRRRYDLTSCRPQRGKRAVLGIEQAAHALATVLEHMGIDHSCPDVLVPQEFLYRANIIAILSPGTASR